MLEYSRYKLIDSHCHIQDEIFDNDYQEVIERAKKNNIESIVVIGTDISSIKKAIKIKEKYSNFIFIGAAFHPTELSGINEKDKFFLEDLCKNKYIDIIGETGLDYYWNKDNKKSQKSFFEWHIDLSLKYNLPFTVHTREAYDDTFNLLENKLKNKKFSGIIHSYSGSLEMAKKFIELGFYLSFSGVVTFKNAKNVKKVVEYIPLNRILIETDSPYLTPEPYRGKRNEPMYINYILKKIIELRKENEDIIQKQIYFNTLKVLKLL